MRLRVIVDRLDLQKEKISKTYGDIIEVSDERAKEITNYKFNGQAVVEPVYGGDNEELLATIKQLEEEKNNLILEKEELEAKVKKLEETVTTLTEKEELEEKNKNFDVQNKKSKGEDK